MEKITKEMEPYYEYTFIMCVPICKECGDDPTFPSKHKEYSDEWYLDQAIGIKDAGWVIPQLHEAVCKKCAEKEGLEHDPEAYGAGIKRWLRIRIEIILLLIATITWLVLK